MPTDKKIWKKPLIISCLAPNFSGLAAVNKYKGLHETLLMLWIRFLEGNAKELGEQLVRISIRCTNQNHIRHISISRGLIKKINGLQGTSHLPSQGGVAKHFSESAKYYKKSSHYGFTFGSDLPPKNRSKLNEKIFYTLSAGPPNQGDIHEQEASYTGVDHIQAERSRSAAFPEPERPCGL